MSVCFAVVFSFAVVTLQHERVTGLSVTNAQPPRRDDWGVTPAVKGVMEFEPLDSVDTF